MLLLPMAAMARVHTEYGCVNFPIAWHFRFEFRDSLLEYQVQTFDSISLTLRKDTDLTYNYPVGTYKMWVKTIYTNSSTIDTIYFVVNPKPVLKFDSIPSLRKSDPPFNLSKYATPVGGKWSSKTHPDAVSNNYFDPSRVPAGRTYLTYTYVDPKTRCVSSDSVPVDVGEATSIHYTRDELLFKVYPNPARDALHVELSEHVQTYSIRLKDIEGKIVYTAKMISGVDEIIPLSKLNMPNGMYLIEVLTDKGSDTQPFFYSR